MPSRWSPGRAPPRRVPVAAVRRPPDPRARRAAGNSVAIASRSATAAAPTGTSAWHPRPAAPAPARGPDRPAVRPVRVHSARRAPRHRAPHPARRPTVAARRGSRHRRRSRTPLPTTAAGCGSCVSSPASGAPSRTRRPAPRDPIRRAASTCSATARWMGSTGALRAPSSVRAPLSSTRASLEPCPAGTAPASSSRFANLSSRSRSPPLGQLQLPFAPLLLRAVLVRLGGHLVVAELGERQRRRGRRARRRCGWSRCGRPGASGRSRTMANTTSRSGSGTSPRPVGVERLAHLGAGVRSRGQFEVPPGVGAAGAPAQRDVVGGQVVARRVEVDRVELLGRRTLHPRDRRQALERRRHRRFDDVELALDLQVPRVCLVSGFAHGASSVPSGGFFDG